MKKPILLLLGVVVTVLAACSTQKSEPTPIKGIGDIPTFALIVTPTPLPIPISADDPRFPIEPALASRGQQLYEANCASCHGVNGEGQYPDDPYKVDEKGLIGAPPHTVEGHTWHHPDQVLLEIIYNGQSYPDFHPMPAFGDKLSVEDIMTILAYIKTWWGPQELEMQRGATAAFMEGQ